MDTNEKATQDTSLDHATNQNPRSYNFLLRMSKRLGRVATRSFVEVRQFLNQEITLSPSERFLAGMPKLKLQKHDGDDTSGQARSSQEPQPGEQGRRQAAEEKEKEVEEGQSKVASAENLEKIIKQSHEVLAEANTVFPITLFPDTVFVDRTKVTIIKRDFFWSSDTMSFRIEDVLNVSATLGPLFGSLTIASRVMSTTDHFQIKHFWRSDAIRLKRIIQGYVIAQHNKIDVAHLSKDELIRTLGELGHDKNS
jgi:hypothetical protein